MKTANNDALKEEIASIAARYLPNKFIREQNGVYWTMINQLQSLITKATIEARIEEVKLLLKAEDEIDTNTGEEINIFSYVQERLKELEGEL